MVAVTFDKHKFVRKLKESGFNDRQAEVLTDAVQEAQASADVATKADLREYESAIRSDLEKLEMCLDVKHELLRKDINAKLERLGAELRGEMTELRSEMKLMKWMLGIIAVSVVPLAIKTFLHF